MASVSTEPKEEFHYFSGKESPFHPHHKAEFQVDGVKYNFIEQYVLHKKAEMCKATKDAAELMKITDPNHLKQFEKKFIVADAKLWETKHKELMKKGYLEKSRQVLALFNLLQDTKGKNLVYATRKDFFLGIGVDANDPLSRRRSNWKGKNLLGEWLMEVREELPNQLESSFDNIASKQEATHGSPRHEETVKEKESDGSEKFTFFWKKESPFSQWHPCSFAIDDQWYNCAEQYMMHQKAVTFGDHQTAQQILKSKDPKDQKQLGRKVANFDDKKWSPVSMDVVRKGNLAKFGQNEELKGLLFETAGTTLVEASPVDNIWGIGLAKEDPRAKDRKQWLGKNQLGQVLTEVREELMRHGREKVPSKDGERSLGEKGEAGKLAKRKADDINQGQERKSIEGATDAKVPKGHDPTALRKEVDQRKGDSQGGKNKRGQTQRQNSSQRKGKEVKEENNDVEMRSEVENWLDKTSNAESVSQDRPNISLNDKTEEIVESSSLSKACNEAPVERMEYSDTLHGGNEETEGAVDPAWEGFNTMELDIEEDGKEKKKRERSKDEYQERSDRERTLKKGKTGYDSRQELEKRAARSKFDDQAPSEKFTFFWRADSPFSQHHPANFVIDGVEYNCAEQFMMHQKAVVFKDERIGYEIMHTSSPAKQKSLAKQVEGFNEVYWKTLRRDVVKRGNIAKFSQNPRLRRILFATAGTTMVESSPVDNTWGIGLNADDPKAWLRQTWAGGNLLGEILTEVREELMEKFKNIQEDEEGWMSYKDFIQRNTGGYDEQYTVFWRPVSPFHPRYPVGFEVDNQYYWTLQQYLLHQKALFFNDSVTARDIMDNFRPNKLEELGRKIRNYDLHSWSRYCRSCLRQGNFAKFSQNPNIRQQLIDNVRNGELVYAVVDDCLLGVGLKDEDGRLYQKKSWKGKNLLGRALMEVRDMLMKNEQTLPEIVEDLEDEAAVESSYSSQDAPERQFQFFFIKSPFNQWHLCRFIIGNIQYNSAEQYMLHQMALHFHDKQAAESVMRCRHPRDMQTIDIRNYDQRNWENVCQEIIMEGNRAKFTQAYKLREELSKTEDAILAYASVKDVLLGIGLRDTDPLAYDQRNWPGYNILGQVLMEIRDELKQQRHNSNNNSNRMWKADSKESIPYPKNDQSAEKFTFFWQKSPFSQWWKCSIEIDEIVYNCSEQYMMHQKALCFSDEKAAHEIMKTGNPKEQWQLGRRVQGYANDKWNAVCEDVVRTGNMAKFSQHPRMRQELFETAGTTLVEASPKDCKWGIGVVMNDPRARRRGTWLGENRLGQILTEVRDELMKQESDNTQTYSASNIPGSGSGHDRRGSERGDSSQGRRKDSESNSKGFSQEPYQKFKSDHAGAAGKSNQQRDRRTQWTRQHSRSERGDDTVGRPNQHHPEGNQWSQQNSRSFHGERPHVDESRHSHGGDRQRQHLDSSADQHRNLEKQHRVEEFKSIPIGHSQRLISKKSRSTPSGQSQRPITKDLHSVPAERSKAPISSGTTQSLLSGDSNTDSRGLVDGAENIHIFSENAALSVWHKANFKVDEYEYKSVGQYLSHQKALRFNDGDTADEIMKSTSIGRIIKCDKYVDGFDEKKWNSVYRDVIKDGNYNKFSQNEDLKQELLATTGSLLVYADVKDRKLGVGMSSNDRGIRDRKRWKGENVLGFVLMQVRDEFINGRDSSKTKRDQVSNHMAATEITEDDKSKDVQDQTLDRDVKAVKSEDMKSLDTRNLGVTNSFCPQGKGEPQKDTEAAVIASSGEYKKDSVSKVQRPENVQETDVPDKDSLQETVIPEKENLQDSVVLEKENLKDPAVADKGSLHETESLQETAIPKAIHEESTPKPPVSTDDEPDSKGASKVVELSGALVVQHKVEAAEINSEQAVAMVDEETEVKSSKVTNEAVVETSDIPQSSLLTDETQNNKNTIASEISVSSESDDVLIVSRSEAAQTVAKSDNSSKTECVAKKDLAETQSHMKDSVFEGIPELGSDSKIHQTTSNDTTVSDTTAALEPQGTSQNQACDEQKNEDKQTVETQVLATNKTLGTTKEENAAAAGVEKMGKTDQFSKDSANGESHPKETVSAGLEAQATTAHNCQVISDKQELDEKRDLKETSDSTKEDSADKIVDEIHQEDAISKASKIEALQAQGSTEDMVQQASTTVKEEPDDESSTESQPEEAISASITENISPEKTSLKEELDKKDNGEGSQEVASTAEKETVGAQTEIACQETSVTPVDKSTSSAEISKEEDDVLDAEREVLGAQSNNETKIQVKRSVEEELEDKSGLESHQECVSTKAKTEMLPAQISSANTHPVDVELTGKSEIKLTPESVTEKPDKSSTERNQVQATSADMVKVSAEIFEDKTRTENSCQEIKPVADELDDKKEEKLKDKSSVESIPEEGCVPVAVNEILGVKANTETSCQVTKLVKDELDDKREAQLADKSSVESIPEEASVPPAVQAILEVKASNTETSCQETKLVKEELDKTESQLGDKSSVESIPEEASALGVVKEVLETQTSPQEITSIKEELVGKVEVALDDKSSIGTKEDPQVLTDLQTGETNAEIEENSDQKTSQVDSRDKIQTEANHIHKVSSHS